MEVWLSPRVGFDVANAKATIYGNGDQPICWISLADVIHYQVVKLFEAKSEKYPIVGPIFAQA